jgi:alpha-N-acetylglucosamine transferase
MVEQWSAAGLPLNQLVSIQQQKQQKQPTQQRKYQKRQSRNHTLSLSTTFSFGINCCQRLTIDPHGVPQKSKYAYAFLLGGALGDTSDASNYLGGLFSVVVAAHALRRQGSTADMILMVQMSARSNATRLPDQLEEMLQKSNVRLSYLPKYSNVKLEVFYSLQLEKFRILQFEEYRRITYLDYDMLPYCSLDYLMELSDGTSRDGTPPQTRLLQDNVIMAYNTEPSSGGLFILRPNITDYQRMQNIIRQKEQRGLTRKYPHWDQVEGWGQVIPSDQPWRTTLGETGRNWTWHGAHCDQGLLYYWTKFIQHNVSIIIQHQIEQWGQNNETGKSQLIDVDTSNALYQYGCRTPPPQVKSSRLMAPYNSFIHLTGRSKPWYGNLKKYQLAMVEKKDQVHLMDNKELWFWLLQDALQLIGMKDTISLDFISEKDNEPAVGTSPTMVQMALYLRYKARNGWRQYECEEDYFGNATVITNNTARRIESQTENSAPNIPYADTPSQPPKYAYVFLLGGARSKKEGSDYRGGLYSVVVAAHLFRKHGSKADVVLMVQVSADTKHTKLKELEEEILKLVGVKIVYLPKFLSKRFECFYSLMMMKFHILNLTDYRRVMYLDFDVMPRCNMDYLFELSDPSPTQLKEDPNRFQLKSNVGVAFKGDPANGGIFLMTPSQEDFQHIQRIIHDKEEKALDLPYPHWNETIGWGHEIKSPDFWRYVYFIFLVLGNVFLV